MTLKKQFTSGRPDFAKTEEEVLAFWDETDAFKKSVEARPESNTYIFYDGPPFANGLPHYGHLLSSTSKDVVARYHTMRGQRVERVWGWDCHGVPIENAIEKELKLTGGKKGIEALGIDKFNAACRASIMTYDKEWRQTIRRLGRWVDFEHAYKTMDTNYMESVWWGFKQLFEKDLIYQGRKVILYCPRCSTPLSNFEIAMDNSYQDTEDWSAYVKFKVKGKWDNEYFLAWTTTPWTLPGNVALAVVPEAEYSQFSRINDFGETEYFWAAKNRVQHIGKMMGIKNLHHVRSVHGRDLVGIEYEPLYTYMPLHGKKAYFVVGADFVSLEEGTGIVHTAAIFGEDDYRLAVDRGLPTVPTLDDQGKFLPFVEPLSGIFFKKAEDWILTDLSNRGLLLNKERIVHSYPFCYRCSTPLYFNALPAWFINVQHLKRRLIDANEFINWYPSHLKYGRFGKGLETAPDWNISRSRYWGLPMPIWEEVLTEAEKAERQPKRRVIGSLEELKHWAVDPKQVEHLTDLHREFLDPIEVWIDNKRTIKGKRVFEVFDCWVESASMPFAAVHYPFENKEKFDASYPAQFISEYIAQTRAWFYCMHVLSVGIFGSHAFENCLTTGTILAEDGSKMSKSKKNYPDPSLLVDRYGSDSLRLYLMNSTIMKGENLNFSEKSVHELQNKVINTLWNVYGFWAMYVKTESARKPSTINYQLTTLNVLDRWLLSKAANLVAEVTEAMENYDVVTATRLLIDFTGQFSTWYLRLSRARLKTDEASRQVFERVLVLLCKLYAPFIPFLTEIIFQNLTEGETSIHLAEWPAAKDLKVFKNLKLEAQMDLIMMATEAALAQRKEQGIKVRQPLSRLTAKTPEEAPGPELTSVLAEEVNVEKVLWEHAEAFAVELDTVITPELKRKGEMRDAVRAIQDLRKGSKAKLDQPVRIWLPDWPEEFEAEIKKKTLTAELLKGGPKIELLDKPVI